MFTGGLPQSETTGTFEELGLSGPILGTLAQIGFESPTPIQSQVIPLALAGRDIIGLAQTGSTKPAVVTRLFRQVARLLGRVLRIRVILRPTDKLVRRRP